MVNDILLEWPRISWFRNKAARRKSRYLGMNLLITGILPRIATCQRNVRLKYIEMEIFRWSIIRIVTWNIIPELLMPPNLDNSLPREKHSSFSLRNKLDLTCLFRVWHGDYIIKIQVLLGRGWWLVLKKKLLRSGPHYWSNCSNFRNARLSYGQA